MGLIKNYWTHIFNTSAQVAKVLAVLMAIGVVVEQDWGGIVYVFFFWILAVICKSLDKFTKEQGTFDNL